MREWVEVAGRRIRLHDDDRTQSVNICTPSNEAGLYEQVFYFTGEWRVQPEELTGCTDLAASVVMLRERSYRQTHSFSAPPAVV